MFMGTYTYALDDKGRLFLPARLRVQEERSAERYVITQGMEGCLYLYERRVFLDLSRKLSELPLPKQTEARAFRRLFLAGAAESDLDPQGRLLLPKGLIQYAGIRKDITIIGVGDHIELWAKERWSAYLKRAGRTFHRIGDKLNI